MDDVNLKIAELEKQLAELRSRITLFGERLAAGENAVRAELNPAIRRERELSQQLHDLNVASGRRTLLGEVMYGPPFRFLDRKSPPAPMYGPPFRFWLGRIWRDRFGRR